MRTAPPSLTLPIFRAAIQALSVFGFSVRRAAASGTVRSFVVSNFAIDSPFLTYDGNHGNVGVYMELRHHIDIPTQLPKCRRAVLVGDELRWDFFEGKYFDVMTAYKDGPHRDLIAARDDDQLRLFVRKWGPLVSNSSKRAPVSWYRDQRDQFAALTQLLAAIEIPALRRPALRNLLPLVTKGLGPLHLFEHLKPTLGGILNEKRSWCDEASQHEIDGKCFEIVNGLPFNWTPQFSARRYRRTGILTATIFMHSLWEALLWMIWTDVANKNPFKFCEECNGLIMGTTKHARKFCTEECAKRKTDREWKRAKRKTDRDRKRKLRSKDRVDSSHKRAL